MKKLLLVLAALAVVVVAALFWVGSNLDGIVKKAVVATGPKITQTTVTLDGVIPITLIEQYNGFGRSVCLS